jgi:hypothetical protein
MNVYICKKVLLFFFIISVSILQAHSVRLITVDLLAGHIGIYQLVKPGQKLKKNVAAVRKMN